MWSLELPPERHGVFSSAELAELGLTYSAVRRAIDAGRLRRVRAGAYWIVSALPKDSHDLRRERHCVQAVAAALVHPTAVVSHASAAVLRGLPVLMVPVRPCLTAPGHVAGRIRGVHLHEAAIPNTQFALRGGVRVATTARSVVDIAREAGARAGVVTADAALRPGFAATDDHELRAVLNDCAGWPGLQAARDCVDLADPRSESPLESLSRVDLRGRVPKPELQASICDGNGRFLGRPDFLWEELGVAGEADGLSKYTESSVLRAEKQRQELLEGSGLVVVRWGMSSLSHLDELQARLELAFLRSASSQLPRRWIAWVASQSKLI